MRLDFNGMAEGKRGTFKKVQKLVDTERLRATVRRPNFHPICPATFVDNIFETGMYRETTYQNTGKTVVDYKKLPENFDLEHYLHWVSHFKGEPIEQVQVIKH